MTNDVEDAQWAMDFDGRYYTFERDGRFHVHEIDGTPKAVVNIDWKSTA